MLTTVERRFEFSSRELGIILIMDNIGNLGTILFLSYFGGKAKRPLVMGIGMLVNAVGAFTMTLPHFVFGPGQTNYFTEGNNTDPYLCAMSSSSLYSTSTPISCDGSASTETRTSIILICLGYLMIGAGGSGLYSLGVSYLDDNVEHSKAPVYIGFVYTGRFFGPIFGFLVFSLFGSYFVDPSVSSPGITESDPRWVGAWWMGLLSISFLMLLAATPMLFFPKQMPEAWRREREEERKVEEGYITDVKQFENGEVVEELEEAIENELEGKEEIVKKIFSKPKELLMALWELNKNVVFMLMTLAVAADLWGVAAVFSFQPKYVQNQFGIPASQASIYGGATGLTGVVIGSVVGGYTLRRFHIQAKGAALSCAIGSSLFGAFSIALIFIGCSNKVYQGQLTSEGMWNFTSQCNTPCLCSPTLRFSPVCDGDLNYFTPCHAGCIDNGNITDTYSSCQCSDHEEVRSGHCDDPDCDQQLTIYLIVLFLGVSIGGTAAVGGIIVKLRCVPKELKPLSLGYSSFLYSCLGFIPAPIVIGTLIDRSCTFWSIDDCGEQGACWIYDNEMLRRYVYGSNTIIKAISVPLYLLAMAKCPSPWRLKDGEERVSSQSAEETSGHSVGTGVKEVDTAQANGVANKSYAED